MDDPLHAAYAAPKADAAPTPAEQSRVVLATKLAGGFISGWWLTKAVMLVSFQGRADLDPAMFVTGTVFALPVAIPLMLGRRRVARWLAIITGGFYLWLSASLLRAVLRGYAHDYRTTAIVAVVTSLLYETILLVLLFGDVDRRRIQLGIGLIALFFTFALVRLFVR